MAGYIIQIIAFIIVFVCLGRMLSIVIKLVKMMGVEGMLQHILKQMGLVDFHLASISERFFHWKRQEKYDKEKHYRKWVEENFPDWGKKDEKDKGDG